MISIKPPVTTYESLNEIGKFNMIWNVSVALIPVFIFLFFLHIYFGDDSWVTSLSALGLATFNLIVLNKTRRYEIVGGLSVFFGIAICQVVIFVINDSHIISDTMWCLLVSFFTYFLFGTFVGTIVLLVNLTGLVVFLMYASPIDVINKGVSIEDVNYKMVINVYYVALALAFIIYKMLDNNKKINERSEKEIRKNEVLLKEIHHRVKNNLQIVSSLLRLQAAEADNEEVTEHFQEAVSRIRSMSLIHEKMYKNDNLAEVDISSYLLSLTQDITASFSSECNIEMKVVSEISKMNVEVLVPLSLIFNEMITNSVKHAFKDKKHGEISVFIVRKPEKVQVTYSDNGTWRNPSKNEPTFGLDLIGTLVGQLDGSYTIDTSKGTSYIISIDNSYFK